MKIIERGKGDWKRVKCPHCKSKLEASASDVFLTEGHDELGGSEDVAKVRCPVCERSFSVDVPSDVIESRKELEKMRDHDL